jgi:DNA transposition AAA+ family ATPase
MTPPASPALVIVDEADRLTIKSLEHLRDMADRHGFGLILMGMPGWRSASPAMPSSTRGSASSTSSNRLPRPKCGCCSRPTPAISISFDPAQLDAIEAQAAVIRITRGNFRLMERLFAQMRRIMTLNRVEEVTADIVQAARDCLVIGPGN